MKQKHLLSLLFMLAALLSGCSSSDDLLSEVPSADRSQTYEATVVASKGKIDGLDNVDEGTRAVFYGGNDRRYVTLWDVKDVVYVYKKNGTCVGQLRVTDSENKDAEFQLSAVLSGDLTGEFEENEELDLYLPSKDRTYNPETHQKGTINDLSLRFSFQKTSVQIDKIEGTKITHKTDCNIISDGMTTGAVQVPGSGQPIIMMSERQTIGGYTKIASVITADLPLIGQSREGDILRFKSVSLKEAHDALREIHNSFMKLQESMNDSSRQNDSNSLQNAMNDSRMQNYRVKVDGKIYHVSIERI